jgi:hypothetical protein
MTAVPRLTMPSSFGRTFRLWSYEASNRVMLLRSGRSPLHPTRIDLMLRNVEELRLPTTIPDLSVDVLPRGLAAVGLGTVGGPGVFVFGVSAGGSRVGFVLAGSLHLSEDDLSSDEPSTVGTRQLAGHIMRSAHFG